MPRFPSVRYDEIAQTTWEFAELTTARTVTTIQGKRYRLARELGRGGQGAVFAVQGGRLAVKLFDARSGMQQQRLRDQLAMVGRFPLAGLPLARPIESLRPPHVGYVMEHVTGMVPLRTLSRPPAETQPIAEWYTATGGLRRRLRILARTAEIFATLHGLGLVFVDPSPGNIFVSEHAEDNQVRLIDTDNLRVSTSPGDIVYTPRYGAPEIVRNTGVATSLSDAYAFAVTAFETICLVHPLLGDWVQQGEPELEEQALAGNLPWIEDPDDSRNRASDGIPRQWVLSKSLQENFQKALGPGRMNPLERPGTIGWAEAINRAADRTLVCSSCRGSYYHNFECCPWCDEPRPTFAVAEVLLWDPAAIGSTDGGEVQQNPGIAFDSRGKPKLVDAVVLTQGDCVTLDDRITYGTGGSKARLQVAFHEGRISVKALDGQSWTFTSGKRKQHVRDNPVPISVGAKATDWMLHCGPPDRLHRVIRFQLRRGAQR